MAGSKFDKVVEVYVKSVLSDEEKNNPSSIAMVANGIKKDILSDLSDEEVRQMKINVREESKSLMEKAVEEAANHKKSLIRKAEKGLIYEAIFLAFCVGMIVNQATDLLPEKPFVPYIVIIVALLASALLLRAEAGKD